MTVLSDEQFSLEYLTSLNSSQLKTLLAEVYQRLENQERVYGKNYRPGQQAYREFSYKREIEQIELALAEVKKKEKIPKIEEVTGDEKENKYKRPLRIFICHSSSDKLSARQIYHNLKSENIDPWIDEEKLLPGQDWDLEIKKAIHEADVVIVCLSKVSTTKSGFINKEIKYALDVADNQPEGIIFIIPLKLEECILPERLKRWHCINFFDERGYDKLRLALQSKALNLGIITNK